MLIQKSKEISPDSNLELNTSGPGTIGATRSELQRDVRPRVQDGVPIQVPTLQVERLNPQYTIPFHAEEGPVEGRPSQPRHPISGMVYFGPLGSNPGDVDSQNMIDDLRKAGFTLTSVATYSVGPGGKTTIVGWRLEASRTVVGTDGKPHTESYSEDILVGDPPRKEPKNNKTPTTEEVKNPLKNLHDKISRSKEFNTTSELESQGANPSQEKKSRSDRMMELLLEGPVGMPFDRLREFLSPPPSSAREWKLLLILLGTCKDTEKGEALDIILSKLKDPEFGHVALAALQEMLKKGDLSPESIEKITEILPFLMEFLEEEKAAKGDPQRKDSRLDLDIDAGAFYGEPSLIASSLLDTLMTDPRYAETAKRQLTKYAKTRPSPEREQLLDGIAHLDKAQKLGLIPPSAVSLRYLGELVRNRESPEQDSRPVAEVIYSGHDPQGAFTTDTQRNIEDLIRAGYKVVVHRVNDEDELRSALQERARLGGADLLLVIGHGTPNGIKLGNKPQSSSDRPAEGYEFDTGDNELKRPDITGAVKPHGTVVLHSCSTGKTSEEKTNSNMGQFMRELFPHAGVVIAPDADIPGMIFEFDPQHHVSGVRFEGGNAVRF